MLNRSKFFLSTLIAAAAMTAPAWAETYTVTGAVYDSSGLASATEGEITNSSGTIITNAIALTADDTVIFNGATGYLPGWNNGSFVANIVLSDDADGVSAFVWKEGSSSLQTTITFSGSLSGSGTFEKNTSGNNKRQCFIFTGNISNFTGDFKLSDAEKNTLGVLTFGNGGTANTSGTTGSASGSGAIIWNGQSVVYNYSGNTDGSETVTISNSSISTKDLKFQGGASYSVSSAVTAETLNLSAGTLTLKGNTTVSSALTVASGTTLTNAGTLNLSGATVSLTSAITNTETGTVTLDSSTTFVLSPSENVTLFSGDGTVSGWDSLTYKNFTNSDGVFSGRTVIDKDNHAVTLGIAYSDMVWDNASGDGKWNSSSENWTSDTYSTSANLAFADEDSVTFSSASSVVTVEGTVTPKAMTVSAATSFTGTGWTINAGTLNASADISISGGTVAVSGTFTIADGVSVSGDGKIDLGSSGKLSGTLSEEWKGTVSLSNRASGESLSSYGNENSTIEINGFEGYFSDQNGKTVSSDLVVNGTLEINNGYSNTTFTISGDVSGNEEACFIFSPAGSSQNLMFSGEVELYSIQILKGGTTTFSGKTTIGTLNVSGGTVVFNGDAEVSTLSASGQTVSVGETGNLTVTGTSTIGTLGGTGNLTVTGTSTISAIESTWTGTVKLKDVTNRQNLAVLGNANSKIVIDGVSSSYLSSGTLASEIEIGDGGLTVDNGVSVASASAGIFSGKIRGAGGIIFNKWNSTSSQTGGYKFTGDMTGFTGSITYNQSNLLSFGSGSVYSDSASVADGIVSAIAGSGTITVSTSADVEFNYSKSANYEILAVDNTISAESSTVSFKGGATYLVRGSLSASGLAISAGKTTLSGETKISGTLSLASGASLLLGVESVSAAELSGGGAIGLSDGIATATLNLTGTDTSEFSGTLGAGISVIKNEGSITFTGDVSSFDGKISAKTVTFGNGGTPMLNGSYVLKAGEVSSSEAMVFYFSEHSNEANTCISSILSGTGRVTILGTEELRFLAKNTYTGATVIGDGTNESALYVAKGATLGESSDVTVKARSHLYLEAGAELSIKNLSGSGNVLLAEYSAGNDATLIVEGGNFDGSIGAGAPFSSSATLTLIKTGTDTLDLSDARFSKLALEIEEGAIKLPTSGGYLYSGAVKIGSRGALYVKPISGAIGISGGEFIFASNSSDTDGVCKMYVDLSGVGIPTDGAENVALNVLYTSVGVSYGDVAVPATLSSDTESGTYATLTESNVNEFVSNYVVVQNKNSAFKTAEWSYTNGTLVLTLTIPEPSAFGLLAGAGALALCVSRRRRRE